MKSVRRFALLFAVTMMAYTAYPVSAQQPMTDDHIARIRSNCPGALATLARIHANDAPVYINYNQTYFSVSDKLMARLNSRLTLNRYDATQLVKTASDYNAQLTRFRAAYRDYDDTMSDVLRMDCRSQPVGFYDKVADARDKRQKVSSIVIDMKSLIDQYSQSVSSFKATHFEKGDKS